MILIYNFFLIFVLNLLKSLSVTLTFKFKSIMRRFGKIVLLIAFIYVLYTNKPPVTASAALDYGSTFGYRRF